MSYKVSALVGQLVLTATLVGCASMDSQIQLAVDDYVAAAPKVRLGMTKAQVVELLQPSQSRLRNTDMRQPDMFTKEGALVEILYFRSGWQDNENFTTDDEFTPYLFKDGKLAAVGWAPLGGPKSQAQARSKASENAVIMVLPILD
jgi:Protein of unknown function (DUF3192)